jgi:ATP-binding cassette subfamily C protein CydC
VLACLQRQMKERTVILATHLREAESADRLLWVEGGRLLGDARRGTADFDSCWHGCAMTPPPRQRMQWPIVFKRERT